MGANIPRLLLWLQAQKLNKLDDSKNFKTWGSRKLTKHQDRNG